MTEPGHFHSHIQVISRGKGKSAVAAAAYRAGETIKNEYDGMIHDYTRKGGIVHTEIMLPGHAPAAYSDRAILWNAVEKIEKADNSQLARELDIALPAELTIEQNIAIARRYVQDTFVAAGMCADLCVHDKKDGNPHMHIMLTMRPINEDGTWGSKQKKEYILDGNGNKQYDPKTRSYKCRSIPSTDWNNQANADIWRAAWEDIANTELERQGFDTRIDRRTYAEQGVEKIPTVHLGPAVSQMEKRGIRTERGDQNREIELKNKEIRQLRARINYLNKWVAEAAANTEPPTLADVITEILQRQGQSGLTRLKSAADVFNFLMDNKVYSMEDLERKVRAMQNDVDKLREDMKSVNRRIDTLKKHLEHSENFKENRKYKRKYDELYSEYETAKKEKGFFAERKAQKALAAANEYYNDYRPQISMFDNAEKYLRGVLQARFDPKKLPPISKWQKELAAKYAESDALYQRYAKLKDEAAKIEKIKRSVKEIMQSEARRMQPTRAQEMEL